MALLMLMTLTALILRSINDFDIDGGDNGVDDHVVIPHMIVNVRRMFYK